VRVALFNLGPKTISVFNMAALRLHSVRFRSHRHLHRISTMKQEQKATDKALRYEGVWGSGCTDPRLHDFDTRGK
jgi:hypothetical protein